MAFKKKTDAKEGVSLMHVGSPDSPREEMFECYRLVKKVSRGTKLYSLAIWLIYEKGRGLNAACEVSFNKHRAAAKRLGVVPTGMQAYLREVMGKAHASVAAQSDLVAKAMEQTGDEEYACREFVPVVFAGRTKWLDEYATKPFPSLRAEKD